MRVAALWFPDWPIQALRLENTELGEHLAIVSHHRIRVCSLPARRAGVRRGMKVRHARTICPELQVIEEDTGRDGRVFAPLVDGLDNVASSVEVLRPGLVIVDAGAVQRFHGEDGTEMLINAASWPGVDVFIGVASDIDTAIIASRSSAVVDNASEFLSPQPLRVLAAEEALKCEVGVVDSLAQLGVTTLGKLAALSSTAVTTRFGPAGTRCHAIARGEQTRNVASPLPQAEHSVEFVPEDPIERVDAAAFAARSLASRLHTKLKELGLSCLRLKVRVEMTDGQQLERIWRTRDALTESATADRIRWQLDGWLSTGGQGAISRIELFPLETSAPEGDELWGSRSDNESARKAISRVQSTLGTDAVLVPHKVGGRGIAERIDYIPYGETRDKPIEFSWPGAIPAPLPARLGGGVSHPASRIRIIDSLATEIYVTAEVLLSSVPYAVAWGKGRYKVIGWAGPWPVDEHWWAPDDERHQRLARLQLVAATAENEPHAWLLMWVGKQWCVEGIYG